ncbi:MAG: hypothetical protein EBU85_01340 [Actinobacteria bacterium]|nr:hypothetical protein [Actinomycetota bacterium]
MANKTATTASSATAQIANAIAHSTSAPTQQTSTVKWRVLPGGALPRTRCCATGCGQCAKKVPEVWQPLPFETDDERKSTADPRSPRQSNAEEHTRATTLTRLCAEICWGLRSPQQSIRWTSRGAYDYLSRRHIRARAIAGGHPLAGTITVRGVRAQIIDDRVMECSAVVLARTPQGITARAIAVRAAARSGSWWVTDIEL